MRSPLAGALWSHPKGFQPHAFQSKGNRGLVGLARERKSCILAPCFPALMTAEQPCSTHYLSTLALAAPQRWRGGRVSTGGQSVLFRHYMWHYKTKHYREVSFSSRNIYAMILPFLMHLHHFSKAIGWRHIEMCNIYDTTRAYIVLEM